MAPSDTAMGISGTANGSPPLRNGRLFSCRRVEDQLDADEREQHGQPDAEVDQPLEQAADEEVELPQAHQREDVRGEDQVGLLR